MLAGLLLPQLDALKREYHAGLGIFPPIAQAKPAETEPASELGAAGVPGDVLSNWRRFKSRVKAIMPSAIWNSLRRVKRVWKALVEPLPWG